MSPHFGSKVVGHEAFETAVRNEQGGGNVFGSRVRDSIPTDGPTNEAKRNTEFGHLVVADAQATDEKGKPGDTVSVKSLRNILAENPTFFDSLYEAELAREGGPRDDALEIFYEVERGIKGAMRQDVMAEIRKLLGHNNIDSASRADEIKVDVEMTRRRLARQEQNATDLGLNERDAARQAVNGNSDIQRRGIASEMGVELDGGGETSTARHGRVPTKPTGDVKPETSQPGRRPGVPKDDADLQSSTGEGDEEGTSDSTNTESETSDVDLDSLKKDDLESYLGEDAGKVKGTGAEDRVTRDDLLKAAKRKQRAAAKGK